MHPKVNKTHYNVSLRFTTSRKIKFYSFALSPQSGTPGSSKCIPLVRKCLKGNTNGHML